SPNDYPPLVDWGIIGNLFMPKGGPMISPEFLGLCQGNPLPMVPFKIITETKAQVLCGLGSNVSVVGLDISDIEDESLRNALAEMILNEIESWPGHPKNQHL